MTDKLNQKLVLTGEVGCAGFVPVRVELGTADSELLLVASKHCE